jgi:riboflavin biosynthesis pyrimidine reductase
MVAAGVLDEVCLSLTPVVVGGDGPRMTTAAATVTGYVPRVMVEEDGTVMGRWFRS